MLVNPQITPEIASPVEIIGVYFLPMKANCGEISSNIFF